METHWGGVPESPSTSPSKTVAHFLPSKPLFWRLRDVTRSSVKSTDSNHFWGELIVQTGPHECSTDAPRTALYHTGQAAG